MSALLIVIAMILVFGASGYYAHSNYGGRALGGGLGLALAVLAGLWLVGG